MKREKVEEALTHISDTHILEATKKKRRLTPWLGAAAAVLAVVLTFTVVTRPAVQAKALAVASESRKTPRPNRSKFRSYEEFEPYWDAWSAEQRDRKAVADSALADLSTFFAESCEQLLTGEENRVWSPVNGYIALAMLAEVTDGASRSQILDTLHTATPENLRANVEALWETVYQNNNKEISALANSLWLDTALSYRQETLDTLSYYHYASVYQADLSSEKAAKALRTWVNNNTGNLLKNSTKNLSLDPTPAEGAPVRTALVLASAVYLKSQWTDKFSASQNTGGVFHGSQSRASCTYMNKSEYQTDYYWGNSFGAVSLGLNNDCRMWFFLPDADKTTADVLAEGEYLTLLTDRRDADFENSKYMKVNLSVPKFDISSEADLKESLQKMGITDVFSPNAADFSAIMGADGMPVWADSVKQAARVAIDEEGVTAASYIVIPGAGAGAPPDEIIDFKLDRPFIFVIETGGIPVFAGVVNQL